MHTHTFWIFFVGYLACNVSTTRQMTLANKHLRMGAVPVPPFLVKNKDNNGQESYSGLIWDLVEYMKNARNCTFTVMIPPDGLWGNCYGNHNCSGMIGMVNRSEVDFAIGKVLRMYEVKTVTFIYEYFQGHFKEL